MDITYTITFHTYWHCGSGLSAGADLDALVIKDPNNLPFVPGKTIKGLTREAVQELMLLNAIEITEENMNKAFGFFDDKDRKKKGEMFFTNAELPDNDKNAIDKNLAEYMYSEIASTAITAQGVAAKHSLRKMEVTMPCTLEGQIINVPDNMITPIKIAFKMIKRLGQNRNRGLGRCTIKVKEDKK